MQSRGRQRAGRWRAAAGHREATRLYKLASDQGNAAAQYNLGLFYEQGGGGLPQDDREAARLYRLAADYGLPEAHAALTRRGWQQQEEEQERQREAAERERQRRQEEQDRRRDVASGNMSAAQALEILGIKAGTSEQVIRAAYSRLMKRVHPDVGGSAYFSKQLNAARDVLLRQLRA